MDRNVAKLVAAFGGVSALSRALDVPLTTVSAWHRSGKIPRWRLPEIERAAERGGIDLPGKPARKAA